MSPRRRATEKQLAALAKARAALAKKHTCERCGCEDPASGLQKHSDYRIYDTLRDGVKHRYCISCRIYFRWIDTRQQVEQELHTLFAEHTPFYLIDTETTSKLESRHCQVVEIAVVNQDGQVVYHSLCKPDIAMPAKASEVNGLTDAVLPVRASYTAPCTSGPRQSACAVIHRETITNGATRLMLSFRGSAPRRSSDLVLL